MLSVFAFYALEDLRDIMQCNYYETEHWSNTFWGYLRIYTLNKGFGLASTSLESQLTMTHMYLKMWVANEAPAV